jgi:hypothetical protein
MSTTVKPEFVRLGQDLLTRIDGESQSVAAVILAASIQMTVEAQLTSALARCAALEKALQACVESKLPPTDELTGEPL